MFELDPVTVGAGLPREEARMSNRKA